MNRGRKPRTHKGPNHILQQERKKRGWSQNRLAELIGASSANMVSRWECGERSVDYIYQEKLCQLFRKDAIELGFVDHPEASEHQENLTEKEEQQDGSETNQLPSILILGGKGLDMNQLRRHLLQILGITGTNLILPLETAYPEQDNRAINDDLLAFLENEMVARWTLYYTGGAAHVSPGFDIWLQAIMRCAQASRGTVWHERAHLLLALGYQLQSCVLRDMMHYAEAHKAHKKSFLIAQELYNPELIASALAREGVTLNQQEKPIEAITCFSQALEITKHLDYSTLEGYILQGLSEAQAKTQQSQESWSSIERAESTLENQNRVPERNFTRLNSTSLIAQKGVNAVLLHEYGQAIDLIDRSLKSYNPTLTRGRARLLIQKAEALYGLGIINACTYHAEEALRLAQSVGANKTITRVRNLYSTLLQSPWRKEQGIAELGAALSTQNESSSQHH